MARSHGPLIVIVGALMTLVAWEWSRWHRAGRSEVAPTPSAASDLDGIAAPSKSGNPDVVATSDRVQATTDLTIMASDSGGQPYAGLRVAAVAGERVVGVGHSDHLGSIHFPASDGAVTVLVFCGEFFRKRLDLPEGQGIYAVEIERGRSLAGQLLVDGVELDEPVQLVLSWYVASSELAQFPSELAKSLDLRVSAGRRTMSFSTDRAGGFAVAELDPTWSGRIELPGWLESEAGEPAFEIAAPHGDLELRARSRPAIIGRVVAPGSRHPVGDAHLTATVDCDRGEYTSAFVCTAAGRFRIPLTCGGLTGAQIWIHAGDQGACTVAVGPVAAGHSGIDLGDIELGMARQAALHIVGAHGEPIRGARICAEGNAAVWSAPSDDRGWLLTPVLPLEVEHLVVSALGYRSATVALPPTTLTPIEVVLHPIHSFTVNVSRPTGERLRDVAVLIAPENASPFEPPFGAEADPKQFELGATLPLRRIVEPATATHSQRLSWVFRTNQDGELLITGLRTGTSLAIHAEDAGGATIAPERRVVIEGRGRQILELVVEGEPKSAAVRVRDDRQTPIPGARVQLGGNSQSSAIADELGVARITGLFADAVDLSITADGYCAAKTRAEFTTGTRNEINVQLERGRSIAVEVLDASGQPAPVEWVDALVDGEVVGVTKRVGLGRFAIQDAPRRAFAIRVIVGGERIESMHAADDASVVEHLPASGSLRLSFDSSVVFMAKSRTLELRRSSPTAASIVTQIQPADLDRGLSIPIVFPGEYEARWLDTLDDSGRIVPGVSGRVTIERGREAAIRVGP
jgi:hypothetical protein